MKISSNLNFSDYFLKWFYNSAGMQDALTQAPPITLLETSSLQPPAEEEPDEECEFLRHLREEGLQCPMSPAPPGDTRPPWFDAAKYRLGQQFASRYYACVSFAETCSLLALFLFDDGLKPLVWTGASGTPYTAFRRYLSTAVKVKSWFETDLFTEGTVGHQSIRTVNAMHAQVSRALNDAISCFPPPPTSPAQSCCAVAPIMRSAAHLAQASSVRRRQPVRPVVYLSQCSLSVTQWGFVGLVVTYPDQFGAGNASEEELEGFLHLWRVIGYLLGIEDRFNFCDGTLEEVRDRSRSLTTHWVIPELGRVSDEWEHYCRCMCRGVSFYVRDVSFEVVLAYLCWTLNVNLPQLQATLTWVQYFRLQFFKLFLCFMLRIPILLVWFNKAVKYSVMKATQFSEEKLVQLRSKPVCECSR
ncbi:uncharacterized protein LOC111064063 isoform X2 [Nilaparvata lugens]|uniref:uncharacterized protein LOC111064063 isoform X2 n=1 Tax=Nilaparvata lugens TaxID=108931 RepID=UPI00193CEAEC|nr:uncharacterized protein LOC111064063 isoform X2 [Nilaparvata lugens]